MCWEISSKNSKGQSYNQECLQKIFTRKRAVDLIIMHGISCKLIMTEVLITFMIIPLILQIIFLKILSNVIVSSMVLVM